MKQLKLEVGKTYRNRKGEEVKIVDFCEGVLFPYRGNKGIWYKASGQWANAESPQDLIEEVAEAPSETRHTFTIPDGVKEITLDYFGNRIVVEMVPEAKGPKPGDVMVNEMGSVYILKEVVNDNTHKHFAWLGKDGRLEIGTACLDGRPATPEEAQPLWDALKKAGKRWNPETMQVEEVPEIDRIREWVAENVNGGWILSRTGIGNVIEAYLNHREGKK